MAAMMINEQTTNKMKRVVVGIALAASVLVVGAAGTAWAGGAFCPGGHQMTGYSSE